jgi:uncharacterized damage-inducible protein DinB
MTQNDLLRKQLVKILDWQDSHMNLDKAIENIPPEQRGIQPSGLPYSLWQLLEHMRLSQLDILEFCRNPNYKESKWPDDYWPSSPAPPSQDVWEKSIAGFRKDCDALKKLAAEESIDLFANIPHGTGQTYLRELLLVADHNAYHIGQIIVVRRLLGIWKD